MSAPAEKVDVLGGLDRIEMIAHRRHWSYEQLGDVRAIRDAVAELIEAAALFERECRRVYKRDDVATGHAMLRIALARIGAST